MILYFEQELYDEEKIDTKKFGWNLTRKDFSKIVCLDEILSKSKDCL